VSTGVLDPEYRGRSLARMREETFDLLVVGGGITGCGIALDAAGRGLSVALVEAHDLARGTSSRSSKLIHGGLRYLEMRDFGLVREALHERRLLLTRLAPHLVHTVPLMFPLRHPVWERAYIGAGVLLYDTMGGRRHVPRARHMSRRAALAAAPALRPDSLIGAVHFHDGQEDDALFAAYVARTAAAHGAAVATRVRVTGFVSGEGGRVTGVDVRDGKAESDLHIRGRHVIVAGGAATDRLLELATGHAHHELRPSKGVHLLVPRSRIPMQSGLFMRTEKSIFHALPWGPDLWLLGDTDTEWSDPEQPVASRADIEYVLGKVNDVLIDPLTADDVRGVFAGVRPLVAAPGAADTTRLSRDHRLFDVRPGMTAIAGGKYTTYRVMARDAVDRAAADLGGMVPPSSSERLQLLGAEGDPGPPPPGLGDGLVEHLVSRHGARAAEVFDLIAGDPQLAVPLPGAERYPMAEAVHACTHQGALDLDDILARRTRIAIEVADRGRAAATAIAPQVAPILGWSDARAAEEVERYRRLRDAEQAAEAAPDDLTALAAYRATLAR
jgi:glycerol-3-phosphate dehydrogenase